MSFHTNWGLLVTLLAALGLLTAASAMATAAPPPPPTDEPVAMASLDPSPLDRLHASRGTNQGFLTGRVSAERSPLGAVRVYAYQLSDLSLAKATTDRLGEFAFRKLPAGLYKIIAHKPGFVPAVVTVTRATSDAYQFLDLQLAVDDGRDGSDDADFWTLRGRIPGDVLRDIQLAEAQELRHASPFPNPLLETSMSAVRGIQDIATFGSAEVSGGNLALRTNIGEVELGIEGQFRTLQAASSQLTSPDTLGRTSNLVLAINSDDTAVTVSGQRNQLESSAFGHSSSLATDAFGFERYGVGWSQQIGRGQSRVDARFTSELNPHVDERIATLGLAGESSQWQVAGSYEQPIRKRASLRTGVSYRQQAVRSSSYDPLSSLPSERIDAFGLGSQEVSSRVMVQYGLYTSFEDGEVSFSPHAGVVFQVTDQWSLEGAARERLSNPENLHSPYRHITPAYHAESTDCGVAESFCYRFGATRELESGTEVRIGALHREFSETLRLYFAEDLYTQLESMLLVPGDVLPEVQFSLSQRFGQKLLANFHSSVATGGGGQMSLDEGTYENRIGYLVTTVDTHWEPTQTGVLVSFQRMEQTFDPLSGQGELPGTALDLDRYQIQLTQEIGALLGLATDWSVSLDMQLSRGNLPWGKAGDQEETRKQVVGGLAVRF